MSTGEDAYIWSFAFFVDFTHALAVDILSLYWEIVLMWMLQDLIK